MQEFIRRLNAREGGNKYRLPTEAEWEYAARGTDGRAYPWGNQFDPTRLNSCDRNCSTTTPMGSYESGKSSFDVYDMAGNVWEWVEDCYDWQYYSRSPTQDPVNSACSSGSLRVIRGGSWYNVAGHCRSAFRDFARLGYLYVHLGFRLVRTAE